MGFTYALLTIGCKVNRVEIDTIGAQLDAAGCRRADDHSVSAVFINTCTVTAEADKKTRKMVRHALKSYPEAMLFIMGCAVAIDPEVYTSMSERVHVVTKLEAPKVALEMLHASALPCSDGGFVSSSCELPADQSLESSDASDSSSEGLRVGQDYRTRVNLKVQDGCDNACTFCIVHVARGASVSVPFDQVVAEAKRYGEAGVRELVLSGINLAKYSSEGHDISDLMRALLDAHDGYRLRLGSVEPLDVDEKLISLMASEPARICHHLHLPLQSGSSKVLAEMNRNYSAEFFRDLVDRLYAAMPELSLSTDIIVGFPGETGEDFAETMDMARYARFSRIHVFRYSKRSGTPAAGRNDQISPEMSAARGKELSALGALLHEEDMRRRCGHVEQVLVEQLGKGMTGSYHGISFTGDSYPVGSLVEVELPATFKDGMYCL